ncbi:TadA family conjugal transfer-associated ATPase [Sanguibacter suaedae]|uniref:TadA family conjugal transfer-associated ATPase n=1 Tax=Sanguibacter suaedae TaxID=2795737 RepID=A0A934IDG8_9MICO|nr:TadA family conjugal transfer-associated ATPase [Sanguibacter suaedae]MBI9115973.1 TadA family conjugal transfer-associated ATPase [Sanguibacter suaedae]
MNDDLLRTVRAHLARTGGRPTPDDVVTALRASGVVLGTLALEEMVREVRAELLGAGPLQHLLDDPDVTDVLVNSPHDVWVDRGRGLERTDLDLGTPGAVRELAVRLAAAGGQRLDDASPTVDARLADGTRLHALLAPLCATGAVISLRTVRARAFTLDDLVTRWMIPPTWEPVLRALVDERASFLVTGATGTGKTTLLATLLSLVDPAERIVTIEEAHELTPHHPHVVALAARHANVEGSGTVTLSDLVRNALRMRPDRIVLGECRGPEVRDVLTALNTGHSGGCATLHANTAADVPARLEALGALAGMTRESLAAQALSALDAVVHLRREVAADGTRRRFVGEIAVVRRGAGDRFVVRPALTWNGVGAPQEHDEWSGLAHRLGFAA